MIIWSVWKEEKEYQKLFFSGMISGIGNRFSQIAVLALLYNISGSGLAIGMLFAIRMAPFLIFAPFGGMLSDRLSKRKLLVMIDLLRIPFAIFPLFVQGSEDLWIIYASAFCIAAGEAIHSPARMATIPALVKPDRLLYVNAMEQMQMGSVLVFGSISGGVISALFGYRVPFIMDGLSFLLSAIFLLKMKILLVKGIAEPRISALKRRFSGKIILGSAALVVFFIIEFTMPLANGIDNVLISVYALDVFQMGDLGVGFIYGALGIGFIACSFLARMLKNKFVVLIVVFIALEGSGHILLSIVPCFWQALITVFFITFVGGMSNICFTTLTMKIIPRQRQGTFFGWIQMISNLSLGISMGVAGFLLELFHPRLLSLIVGMTYIAFSSLYGILFSRIDWRQEKQKLFLNW